MRANELCPAPTNARSRSSGRLHVCGLNSISILPHETLFRTGLDSPRIYEFASRYRPTKSRGGPRFRRTAAW